jgi:hypothetical protein
MEQCVSSCGISGCATTFLAARPGSTRLGVTVEPEAAVRPTLPACAAP